jgi:putative heme-binding domain-containing protein
MMRIFTLIITFGFLLGASSLLAGDEPSAAAASEPAITAPPGFVVEAIFKVPSSAMGSWASLTVDAQGRLIASDEGNKGVFLITLPALDAQDASATVEKLPVQVGGAQGLLWAFDSLYLHVDGRGLFRAIDTDADGRVDSASLIMASTGAGGHGQHGIALAPDGKSLYVAGGNHSDLPQELSGSRIPRNWAEDLLLPRQWDANGHAAGRLAPGGWICQVSPDGQQRQVFSIGYRNQYDLAFNADGELITYDADMEWDMGLPWYRPTRVVHATSGSEFGWRSGTGKWPAYYEDSLPGALDLGPGSPTGVVFGAGAKFPAKYQRACFLLDWTYSTIHAVWLTPHGSSYTANKEDFIVGQPLAVTDAVIGLDGAMYFITGGWGTQTYLYRARYIGGESTAPVELRNQAGAEQRALRRRLEAMHAGGAADVDLIFAQLGSDDRFLRYAARVALEHQPLTTWRESALAIETPLATINAMIALARQGQPADQPAVLASLARLRFAALSEEEQLGLLRAYQLAFVRLGEPDDPARAALVARLDPLFPSKSDAVNTELARLLVYLRAPSIIEKALALIEHLGPEKTPNWGALVARNDRYGGTVARMLENIPPARAIQLLFVLRNVKEGWTSEQRREYFSLFPRLAQYPGGNSYTGFLTNIRSDALKTCSPAEQAALGELASQSLAGQTFIPTPPQGPARKWTKTEALAVLEKPTHPANYDAGRNLFHAQCANCHRLNGEGGAVGPDLSTALRKYSLADMLDSVLEPSKVISDQYGSQQLLTTDGRVLVGRVVSIGDQLYVYTVDGGNQPQVIQRDDVDEMHVSQVSQMPVGLIDPLNDQELLDLIAYLQAAGSREDQRYRSN